MKSKLLLFSAVLVSLFSMQSCVTNYVVSEPAIYSKSYNSNANISSIDSKILAENKKVLINSFAYNKPNSVESTVSALKKLEIAKIAKHTQTIDALLEEAKSYLGTPYRYGGTTRKGIDCSAFVLSVFGAAAGVSLPRVAASQAKEGEDIAKEDLQKGDLLFFSKGRGISHVGIVEEVTAEGDIKFIHAATSKGVMITTLGESSYWSPKFRYAKRIINADSEPVNMAQN
ncbi:C40 family peptidase [Frigoriflavimonas asaccharolytica]|uniref:Lipoprotein Spr n=1 Tax=Frigoriflavimonas asaccharolytica TaxID=2735899 RepID=A0A8J8K8S8_9FLAO|nr:C40 family peptidase [Frigoriflavimonas asaccharolytica]NRS92267.1 lipoprotein Spr [Frigoriflavimonas asaccharolytica]